MDTAFTAAGGLLEDKYCFDFNDAVFVPGDTILYFYGADASGGAGDDSYFSRTLNGQGANLITQDINECYASPCEFEILPSGGYNRNGDILYVDDTDDRGGPSQLFFDSSFDLMAMRHLVDRYDVLGPSSAVGNSLASRVTANDAQIHEVYNKILWCSGNLSSALVGDGTGNPEKSNDFGLLFDFLDTKTTNKGLYLSGDDLANEWQQLGGAGAIALNGNYMDFTFFGGGGDNHVLLGEPISPKMYATRNPGPWAHLGVSDSLVAYGGCALINDFDVMLSGGSSVIEWDYPNTGFGAVLSQVSTNTPGGTSTVVLSGFAYQYIRDAGVDFPPARTEFLRDLLIFMGNSPNTAVGVNPGEARFASLGNNYPNPFNPTTTIKYTIKDRGHVSLKIYNAAGQLVKTLVNQVQSPDQVKPVTWNGRNNAGQAVSSGVYFYKLVTNNFSQTKKMVLLK
jgi:hypothetical protein